MMMNQKALYVAVAASLGMAFASQANALTATDFASELPSGSTLASPVYAFNTQLYNPTTANPLYLQFSLNNSAYFAAAPTVACTNSAGVVTGAPALAVGGATTGKATFVVTAFTASDNALISACTITNGNVVIGTWPGGVTETVVITYGNALAPTATLSNSLLTNNSMFSNAATQATNTALVVSGFTIFSTANAVAGSNTHTAKLGQFALQLNTANLATGSNAAGTLPLTGIVTSITVSLAGDSLAAARATGGVFITYQSAAVAAGSALCTDTLLVSAAPSVGITFSAVSPDPAAGATSGYLYAVCMGTTGAVIPSGSITVGVNGVGNTDPVNANGSAFQIGTLITNTTVVGTITHDGASTTVLNLPPSTNADSGFLRVSNTSPQAGAVTVTVYNEAGTALATSCTLSSSLASNATLVNPVSTIETTCGITPPATGRYRMIVNGAFSTMRAQGLARTSNGTLVNISADTSSNNN